MHPSSFSPPRKRVSLIRSSTSPNPIIQLSSLVPTLPTHSTRRRLVRASTSATIQSLESEKEKPEGEKPEMDSEQSQEGEEESNPFSSLVEDLERATRSQDEPEEEVETNDPLNTSIADELDKLLLLPFGSHSRPLRREDREVTMDYEKDEEDSPNWSPEAMTFQLISRGEGGGGSQARVTNGKRRISYDVPEEGEGWAMTMEKRKVEGIETRNELIDEIERQSSSRWSFDKLFGSSTSQVKEADEEARRDRSRAEGRMRAMKRLKAVEGHLAWSL